MARVNILKQVKVGNRWKLVAIPRDKQGKEDWKALPDGRYFVEWWEHGKRKREAGGATVADVLEVARRRKHTQEGRALGLHRETEEVSKLPLHIGVKRYLDVIEGLKKPNTYRKYKSVLDRFLEYFSDRATVKTITSDDLSHFMVFLKRKYKLDNNSVIHNAVVVAQFLKKQGRPGLTKNIGLPDRIESLPQEYSDADLKSFFGACTIGERTLFTTFLLTGFRDQEMVHLAWSDINFHLGTLKVTAKPELGFYPKRSEEREVPVPKQLIKLLDEHPPTKPCRFVFPSPSGNRDRHMLEKCKVIAKRAKCDEERFNLKTFRSTFATRMLRAGFDVRTVQGWMGHKSLETTMRYLAPAKDVHDRLDTVQIAGVLGESMREI